MAALSCPSCGATHEPRNPGIAVIVCDNCDTTLYVEDNVLRAGKASIVDEPASGLRVGMEGRIGDMGVAVVGRARFEHPAGGWDEYFIELNGNEGAWLVSDERRFSFEKLLPELPPELHVGLKTGETIQFNDATWEVRETGVAECKGGEGQLPRPILPGSIYTYIDLAEVNGRRRLTAEFDTEGQGEAFYGRALQPSEMQFEGVEAPPIASAREGDTIRCAQCGAPATIPAQSQPVQTLACAFCDAVLQLTETENVVIGNRPKTPDFPLDLGDRGELLGDTWEVVGRLAYYDDGYITFEFLCWSEATDAYLWLEYDDLHFVATRSALSGPSVDQVLSTKRKGKLKCGDRTYRMKGSGVSQLVYVDGALPWLAVLGHRHEYIELINPPHIFVLEASGEEIEHFEGEWVPAKSVFDAFGRSDRYEKPSEFHPLQPNGCAGWVPFAFIGIFFFFINACLCMGGPLDKPITQVQVPADAMAVEGYSEGRPVFSEPFAIPNGTRILDLTVRSDVDNSWAYAQVELVPAAEDIPVALTGVEVERYSGYEAGEYWSEGDNERSHVFKAPDPGSYRMVVMSEGDRPATVVARLSKTSGLWRYNCCVGFSGLLLGGMILLVWRSRESGRFDND